VNARDQVLARIRTALGRERAEVDVPRGYSTASPLADDERLALFVDRVEDYQATVRRCRAADIADAVTAALTERGAENVVVPRGLAWAGDLRLQVTADGGSLTTEQLDGFDAVVTACTVGIAETGTIVLDGSPDQGRRATTLVPDLHVCLVRAAQVVGSVPEAVARLDITRPLTWISGPSATSDIELNRVEGVHGPRTLVVVLVEG
jgi:L-lactate dehydrogenase complex protein LldG